jgi:signal peptidase I
MKVNYFSVRCTPRRYAKRMQISAKIPRIAAVVAFLMAGSITISAVFGPIMIAPFALIPLIAGIGIVRRRVWSAYGLALCFFAQIVPVSIRFLGGALRRDSVGVLASIAFSTLLGCLFSLAGRSLANSGAPRGWPLPWFVISAVYALPLLFLHPFMIPTGAMENTLLIGDRVLVRQFPKPSVSRGDLIVFVCPVDRSQTFVKRVIGVPGDRIKIVHKAVYRNGVSLVEPYAVHKTDYEDSYRDNFPSEPNAPLPPQGADMLTRHVASGDVVVPEGCYFVLGDNRDSSLDSRYWGFVGSGDLIGKPLLIYDSEAQSADEIMERRFSLRRPVRWERLFKLL